MAPSQKSPLPAVLLPSSPSFHSWRIRPFFYSSSHYTPLRPLNPFLSRVSFYPSFAPFAITNEGTLFGTYSLPAQAATSCASLFSFARAPGLLFSSAFSRSCSLLRILWGEHRPSYHPHKHTVSTLASTRIAILKRWLFKDVYHLRRVPHQTQPGTRSEKRKSRESDYRQPPLDLNLC